MGQMMIIIMNQILKMGKMMNKLNNPFTPQQRLSLANEVYGKIMIDNIKFKIKNKTVIFTDSKQIDNIFYNSICYCDPNELLRLCSQVVN